MNSSRQSRSLGIMISYFVTVLGSIVNFLMVPVYLKYCGYEGYGFYQYILSIASFATILDFGIGNVICKYITEYREKGNDKEKENVIGYGFVFVVLLSIIVIIVSLAIIPNVKFVFGKMDTSNEQLAKKLLFLFAIYFIIALFQHMLDGIMLAYEKYITIKAFVFIRIVIKVMLVLLLFFQGVGVETISLSDTLASASLAISSFIYIIFFLKIKIKIHSVNKALLKEIIILSTAFCLQSVVTYANNSIDKYLVGRIASTTSVTIYTLGMQFYSFFGEIPDIIQKYYIPETTKLVMTTSDGKKYGDFAVKPGRIQLIILGLIFSVFLLFGKHLIILWSGHDSLQAWGIGIILMAAAMLPFVEGICLTILIALNKRMFRSIILACVAVVNFICSIPLIYFFDAFGAALGTFLSLIIGNCIIMNIYYKKVIGIDVFRMLKGIFKGLLPAIIVATLFGTPLLLINHRGIFWLVIQCVSYGIIYFISMWIIGFNPDEKNIIYSILRKIKRVRRK